MHLCASLHAATSTEKVPFQTKGFLIQALLEPTVRTNQPLIWELPTSSSILPLSFPRAHGDAIGTATCVRLSTCWPSRVTQNYAPTHAGQCLSLETLVSWLPLHSTLQLDSPTALCPSHPLCWDHVSTLTCFLILPPHYFFFFWLSPTAGGILVPQ